MDQIILSQISVSDFTALIKEAVREELASKPRTEKTTADNYISRADVCALLKISKPTLNSWQKTGRIPAHRIGRRVLFKKSEIENSLQRIQTNATKAIN